MDTKMLVKNDFFFCFSLSVFLPICWVKKITRFYLPLKNLYEYLKLFSSNFEDYRVQYLNATNTMISRINLTIGLCQSKQQIRECNGQKKNQVKYEITRSNDVISITQTILILLDYKYKN